MAFIISNNTVISFADFYDVRDRDQRLFDANEGLTEDVVDGLLIRSTERIIVLLSATQWWIDYYVTRSPGETFRTRADVPPVDPDKIQARQNDFTDLCVYYALYNYVLPKIADFSEENNAERQKMGYYNQKFDSLFAELIRQGDWYDFDDSDVIDSDDKSPGVWNLRRVR
jgi:hypothetical protein